MTQEQPLSWFYQLRRDHQVALLANPHGSLPRGLAELLVDRIYMAYWTEQQDDTWHWQLHAAEANALEDERLRLDQWWGRRSGAERAALIEHRGGLIPGEYREAVKDHIPGGVILADDLVGPFPLPTMMAAYVEMRARHAAATTSD